MSIQLLRVFPRSRRNNVCRYTCAKNYTFRTLCILLIGVFLLGPASQTASAVDDELETAEKNYEQLIKKAKELKKQVAEDDRRAKEYAKKNFPDEAAKKIDAKWEMIMGNMILGARLVALLASPILAVKNLMAMYLVHEAMIKDDEIKLLDTTNQKYVAAKAEVDQIDKAIETYNKQIEKEEKCMRLYADAALEVKRKILEGDPYEKAQRELESAIEAASSAIRAREDVRAVLSAAKDAKVKAEAAGNEIKRQKELRETIKNECDRGKKLVEQTKTAKEAAYKHYMEMKDYLNLTEREWKKACAAAARLRQTQFFSQDEMDLLEISSMQAFVKSQDASSECAKRTKLIGEEAQTAENAAEQIEKIREKLTELGNQLVDGAEIQTKLDAIMTKVDARMKETANKPVEADDFAADAQHARDRVAEILAKISSEDRAKKMIAMAEKAAESAKTAAADTKKLATEAQSLVKTLHSDIEALGKRSVNLTKEKKECNERK